MEVHDLTCPEALGQRLISDRCDDMMLMSLSASATLEAMAAGLQEGPSIQGGELLVSSWVGLQAGVPAVLSLLRAP